MSVLPEGYISLEEFAKEVEEVEQIDSDIILGEFNTSHIFFVPHYPFTIPFSDNKTFEEFMNERINPILRDHSYKWTGSLTVLYPDE